VIRALIFDYFGVIRLTGIRTAYQKIGGNLATDEVFIADLTSAAGYGFVTDADQQIADKLGVDLATWRDAMLHANANDPVLLAFIADIHAKKQFKTGLLSNAEDHAFDYYFEPGELERYFDAALSSGDVGHAKPEAEFYRMMSDRLGVEPTECIMIDDREEFCKGAEYIGMQSIQYRNFEQFNTALTELLATQS
jgi:HAD superfamily hydrolase (TIGR01509 family)